MSDLISKKALIEELRKDRESIYSHVFCHTECQHEEELALDLEQMIDNQPSVEAVPKSYAAQIRWERDIAVEQLNDIGCGFGENMEEIKKKLEAEPTWIPCSERLPENNGNYMTCDEEGNIHIFWYDDCQKYPFNISEYHTRYYPVIAWQPLPQPYKGE